MLCWILEMPFLARQRGLQSRRTLMTPVSWDDLSIEVNGFGRKVPLLLSDYGSRTVWKRNLTPATTRNQGRRISFKIGISKFRLS